jgi:hypothetical protein
VVGGERGAAVSGERVEAAGGDAGAQNAVAVGVVDHDDRLLGCLTRPGVCSTPVEGEVRGRDHARHPNGRSVVVDVEDAVPKSVATRDGGAELGARDVEVAREDLARRVAREEVVEVARAEDGEEFDRDGQGGSGARRGALQGVDRKIASR